MDMETRKAAWARRIYVVSDAQIDTRQISLIVSICQDAFNEGHKAGCEATTDFISGTTSEIPKP